MAWPSLPTWFCTWHTVGELRRHQGTLWLFYSVATPDDFGK